MSGDHIAKALNENFAAKMAHIDETGTLPTKDAVSEAEAKVYAEIEEESLDNTGAIGQVIKGLDL